MFDLETEITRITMAYLRVNNIIPLESPMAIYKVTVKLNQEEATRVIEAQNVASAIRFAGKQWITAEVITTAEAMELAGKGAKLEQVE